jgi:hypothetical protein
METKCGHEVMARTQAKRMCDCIKSLKKKIKLRKGLSPTKEGAAIAVCTRSILWPQRRTLKTIKCRGKKATLFTQKKSK